MSVAAAVPAFDPEVVAARRVAVIATGRFNGIDFVEVLGDGSTLLVHLLKGLVPADPAGIQLSITGPAPVRVLSPPVLLAGGDPAFLPGDEDRVLVVPTSGATSGANHLLQISQPTPPGLPGDFDPVLSQAAFRFREDSAADTRPLPAVVPAPRPPSPVTDYLARDADALRTRLVDRFAALVPGWADRSPADPVVMLLELFAALGDRLAYWQDAVGVEAFLGTARRRESVRRHALLLDYDVGEGCSARAWLAFGTDSTLTVRAGTPVADVPGGPNVAQAAADGAVVFETVGERRISPARNAIELHAWSDSHYTLPAGSTSAHLLLPAGVTGVGLQKGDVLILADCPDPADTPLQRFRHAVEGDPALRFAVRLDEEPVVRHDPLADPSPVNCPSWSDPGRTVLEIHWAEADRLPAPLRVTDGSPRSLAVALANVLQADHGVTIGPEPLDPPGPAPGTPFRPRLRGGAPARVDQGWADPATTGDPAAALLRPDAVKAVPALTLDDGGLIWYARRDLLGSGPLDPHVTVQPDGFGGARLRFGEGANGREPGNRSAFEATYRVGGGAHGNVAAGRLTNLRGEPEGFGGAVVEIWNPLPGNGGADPEDVEVVRRLAPAGLRRQERAVTSDDYADRATLAGRVQRSAARHRWNGSWYVQDVAVDPLGTEELGEDLRTAVLARLQQVRMAGTDVTVRGPSFAALWIRLVVRARPVISLQQVKRDVSDVVSPRDLSDGRRGFFHPDRLVFGAAVELSDLVAEVADVPGVADVQVLRFGRLRDSDEEADARLAAARVTVHALEVARCDSDPDRPEAGRVEVTVEVLP